jgi:hypothetical protein
MPEQLPPEADAAHAPPAADSPEAAAAAPDDRTVAS